MSEEKTNFFKQNAELIVFSVLTLLVLVIYAQTVGFSFINLDDNLYIFDNLTIQKGLNWETVRWAFNDFRIANWHPVTWLSHALDVEIFGLNAGGHHATNIVFHLLNTILSFAVFRKMTGSFWKSIIVAALFAVHPAHAESVAWVSERKDVLSTMFWLLTMLVYISYARRKEAEKRKSTEAEIDVNDSDEVEIGENENEKSAAKQNGFLSHLFSSSPFLLFSVIVLFAFGLMSKPMLVTLPFVLLLMDFWSLERLKTLKDLPALIIEKIPLFVLSAISSYVTILAQRSLGAVESLEYLPLGTRFINALVSYAKYFATLFYPANLAVWYPYERDFPIWQISASVILLVGITLLCLWQIGARKYLLMGWLWFLGTLVPVIGIVQVGSQPMADRYTYVPYFGLFIMLVWGAFDVFEKLKVKRNALIALFGLIILIFTALSVRQVSLWRNNEILYKHTLAVTNKNFLISHNLCHHLTLEDRLDEAETFCRQSIEAKPTYYEAYNTYGILQFKRKNYAESEKNFKEAIKLQPYYALAYSNLALAFILQDKPEEAEASLQKASELNSGSISPGVFVNVLSDLAVAFAKQEKYEKSAENLKRLLYISPDNADARLKLTLTYFTQKKYNEAQAEIEELLKINPNQAEVLNLYGLILLEKNKKAEAAAQFEKALQIKPDFADAKANLEKAKK